LRYKVKFLAEIFKKKKILEKKGIISVIALSTLGILILLGVYFLSFTLTESKISTSHEISTQTYYLAEAGINEAIWKLKHDPAWKECFVSSDSEYGCDCDNWSTSTVINTDSLLPNSSVSLSIENSECGRGNIAATSTIILPSGKTSQRVIDVEIFKALATLTSESVFFAGSDTEQSWLDDVDTDIHDGNITVRGDLRINDSSLNVNDDPDPEIQTGLILVGDEIYISRSSITASSTCAADTCGGFCPDGYCPANGGGCACTELPSFPTIDINSTSSSSYHEKAKAAQENGQCEVEGKDEHEHTLFTTSTCVFNYNEFENLLDQIGRDGTLILKHRASGNTTSTYYIEGGGFNLIGGRNLEVNGALIAEGTINIGTDFYWFWCSNGWSKISISHPDNTPSGLFTTGKIYFGPCATDPFEEEPTTITGLIYALDELNIEDVLGEYKVIGGIITNKFSIHAKSYDLYLNNDIIEQGIWGGPKPPEKMKPEYSPIVTIEHWEETY
jgi:hypothetical protein